ncbi:MAG: S8 family serine peptidase [Deltaproteobacteria bacterium]|jgi:subtilisin family serine protease|nr:S8 family serine peptidase [Deltaproteobacteria bacterium]MBW2531219.1 S8 family serine peptidase [Deltaproteobacteria bacterium]
MKTPRGLSRLSAHWNTIARGSLLGAIAAVAACSGGADIDDPVGEAPAAAGASSPKIGVLLRALQAKAPPPAKANRAMPKGLVNARGKMVGGNLVTMVDVLIEAEPKALPALEALGVEVRTVTSVGIMTATAPLAQLNAVAALADVKRIEAAQRVKMSNDNANGLADAGGNYTYGLNNPGTSGGEGVIVGVIDSGLDWTHEDFIDDDTGESRILHYWDQSDTTDVDAPAPFTYGREYDKADFDAYNGGDASAVAAYAEDTNGHGTHVTGTAAGDGSASVGSQYKGGAPESDIIFVKFDFDGDRNSDAAIIDGVDYIFKKAEALGRPAVINMSLGSDFGPHDGSSLEERGIDALTGPGKVVVVAAGNPGSNNWSDKLSWGFAMHGSSTMGADGAIEFTFPTPRPGEEGQETYVFFDIWYDGATKCRVQVTSPSGAKYPADFEGRNRRTWVTGSSTTGYNTPEGAIIVGNGGDQFDWGTDNGDHEIYVEISDYWNKEPAVGTWTIEIVPVDTAGGDVYHAWYGVSGNVVHGWRDQEVRTPPLFGGNESDNAYTIGSPASANDVIAVAAYQSRNEWSYVYGVAYDENGQPVCDATPETQSYGAYPIDYYDPYALGELAYFSGRGPRRDGVVKPDIAAPGVGIISALSSHAVAAELADDGVDKCTDYWNGGSYHYGTNRVLPEEKYTVLQGTSMACPAATGAIALLLQAKPDLTAAELRDLFRDSAREDTAVLAFEFAEDSAGTDTDDSTATPNADWGHGKLDVAAGLDALANCSVESSYCDVAPECGDGTCNGDETCSTCAADCGACPPDPFCGDGTCDADEDCTTCAADCGACPPPPTCGGNKASCSTNSDCCSGVCKGGSCRGN